MAPQDTVQPRSHNDLSWITDDFLKDSLRSTLKNNKIQITSVVWDKEKANSKGENYCSNMYRLTVKYTTPALDTSRRQEVRLIVKMLPDGTFSDFVSGCGFFNHEIEMYKRTLPAIGTHRPPGLPLTNWYPKCFYADPEPIPTLILEDLSFPGFRMANRQMGLDEHHVRLALTSLARYHGSSHALYKKDPHAFDKFKDNLFCAPRNRNYMRIFFKGSMKALAIEMDYWPGNKWRRIADRLHELSNELIEIAYKASLRDDQGFNVMNHGDFWMNNFMFLYDSNSNNNKPIDIRFVDYQLGHLSSPAIDLHYFLHSSLSDEAREDGFGKYLRHYYNVLYEALESLGLESPTFEELEEDFERRIGYGLFTSICILPLVRADPQDATDMNEWMAIDGEIKESVAAFRNPSYTRVIKPIIEEMDRRGII